MIDEAALADAIRQRAHRRRGDRRLRLGAHTESPLFELPQVVVTPHLGASTAEAQDKAGDTIAEQVALALAGEFVPFAVNVSAAEASSTVRPFLPLAERLGQLYAALAEGVPDVLEIGYEGQLADERHPDPQPVGAEGRVRAGERGAGELRQRAAPRRGAWGRGAGELDVDLPRLRQPDHDPRRRPRHRRHPRRAAVVAPPGDGRRPHGRRAPGRAHAGGSQRRRAGA